MKNLKAIFREFQEAAATLPDQTWHISARILVEIIQNNVTLEAFEQEVLDRLQKDNRLEEYLDTIEPATVAAHMKWLQRLKTA